MACPLTKAINLSCRDSKGGISTVYITELANKDTITTVDSGITVFDLDAGKQFWEYQQELEKATVVENIQTSRENNSLFYEADLTISLYKGQSSVISELKLLAQNRLMIIVKDNNGTFFLMGEVNGAMLDPSSFTTGTAFGDMNGYELKFKSKEPNPMSTVAVGLIPALLIPAV